MKFLSITRFAALKKCSRETVYNAARNDRIAIDRSSGIPVIFLTEKNLSWKPGKNIGRPRKEKLF